MTLAEYKIIAPHINAKLKALLESHGLTMGKLTASVNPDEGVVRYSITAQDAKIDGDAERFRRLAQIYGLKPEWLHQSFTIRDRHYKVAGLKATRGAKCVKIESNGKTDEIIRHMTISAPRVASTA